MVWYQTIKSINRLLVAINQVSQEDPKIALEKWINDLDKIFGNDTMRNEYLAEFLKQLPDPLREHIANCKQCSKEVTEYSTKFSNYYLAMLKAIFKHHNETNQDTGN